MDANRILDAYGLPGLVIFGLGWALLIVWRRLQEVQDARLAEAREFNRQILEITREVKDLGHGSIDAMDSLSDVVRESIRHG